MTIIDTLARVDTMASSVDVASTERLLHDDSRETAVMPISDLEEQRVRTVAAKLSLPHMGFILGRARLRTLVEPVQGGGVISVVAGPGYGKTALIVDLLSSATGQTVYFSVDEGDRDPVRFLNYLMAGLGAEPASASTDGTLDWSTPGGPDAAVLDLTAETVDFISGLAGRRTLVAIDDLHLVESSPQVVGALELIIRGLPPGWTLLLSSRRPLPVRLDTVTLGGRLVRLHGRELRLTPREVAAWTLRNWSVPLDPPEARALWRLTQGWPAALVLLGQRLVSRGGGIDRKDVVEIIARGRDLCAYLEADILSGLDDLTARTMLTAGLLPRVMFPRDEAFLPGPPGCAEAVLDDLVARGFLVTRTGRRMYTIHPLVRAFAERKARLSDEARGLIGRAAQHLECAGEHHHAAALYLRAGHYRDAGRPLRQLTLSSLNAGAVLTKAEWWDLVGENVPSEDADEPWLLVAKARILQQQAKFGPAAEAYDRAARSLAAAGDKEGLLPVLLGSAFCLFNQGRWDESLAVMKRCRSLARTPHEKVEVLVMEGGVLVGLCRWDEAVENWERALALAPEADRGALMRRVHLHRARLFYSLGHYKLATPWAEKALRDGVGTSVAHALALNGAAVLSSLTGDYDGAARLADECERLVRTRGYALAGIPCLLTQASVAQGRWDYRRAVTKIREAQSLALKAGDIEECFYAETMLGDLCRRNGNAARALEHHRTALDLVDRSHLAVFERVQAMAAVGMDLAVLGREADAQASLEETAKAARRWGLKSALAPALFYLGWLHARAGREHDASRSLHEAMRIATEHEHVHFFCQEAKAALPVLALCERYGAEAFVRAKILPLLPERLHLRFRELTAGGTYPTDEPLGLAGRRRLTVPDTVAEAEQPSSGVIEGIESLTDRQREILKMIALGMPNKEIGAKLYISEKTVKTHANQVFRKLGVNSRLQATLAFQSYQRARATRPITRPGRR